MKQKVFSSFAVAVALLVPVFAGCAAEVKAPSSNAMFPFNLPWDDASNTFVDVASLNPAPIDASRQITVKNGHFYDKTGRRVRFLGTNMGFTANFPSKSDAEKIAARMHKFGINCVRLQSLDYQMPNGLISSNFSDTLHLDSGQWDSLDYFVAALKKNGIYIDIELHVQHTFTAADGAPNAEKQPPNSKKVLWYEPRLIELQKQFAKNLLDHINPYTGLRYGADPVLAMIEIVNEDSLTLGASNVADFEKQFPAVYVNDLKQGWNVFLLKKYRDDQNLLQAWSEDSAKPVALNDGQSLGKANIDLPQSGTNARHDYLEYLTDLEDRYSQQMRDYLKKDLDVHAAINCSIVFHSISGLWRENKSDFVDEHAYWQHPKFPSKSWSTTDWSIENTPMVVNGKDYRAPFHHLSRSHISDKPFTVTEFDEPSPNDYSAETLPLLASFAVWDDWDGIFLFSYNKDKSAFHDDYFKDYFANDHHPGKMAFFPAAARIFLGDKSLCANVATRELLIPNKDIVSLIAKYATDSRFLMASMPDIWNSVGTGGPEIIANPIQERFAAVDKLQLTTIPPSGNAKMNLKWQTDAATKTGLYNAVAPQWNAVVNYNSNPVPITSGDLTITPLNKERPFGVYTLTSMDNKPVNTSNSLLLTAGGFVENQDMGWNADRTSVGDQWGHGPVMAEGLEAAITLKTSARHATVYALDATGKEKEEVPSKLSDGELTFAIGPKFATMWYAIEK